VAALLTASAALPVPPVVPDPVPVDPVPVDAVSAGIVTDTLTFEEPPAADALPPWPMPMELEPEIEPDDELAVVSA
jgi:hypothetical protein